MSAELNLFVSIAFAVALMGRVRVPLVVRISRSTNSKSSARQSSSNSVAVVSLARMQRAASSPELAPTTMLRPEELPNPYGQRLCPFDNPQYEEGRPLPG